MLFDPTFSFMTVDWDGQIRMDPSSVYAMARMVGAQGAILTWRLLATPTPIGMELSATAMDCSSQTTTSRLRSHICSLTGRAGRCQWPLARRWSAADMIDRVANKLGRRLVEVPVGFKWFVEGLIDGSLGFGGEESSGGNILRRDGTVWTTDKDGIVPKLASRGDHRPHRQRPRRTLSRTGSRVRHTVLHTHRCASDTGAESKAGKIITGSGCDESCLAGEPITAKLTARPG